MLTCVNICDKSIFGHMKNKGFFLIQELQRTARSVFTVTDAQSLLKVSHPAIMAILTRLRRNHLIVTLSNGIYAILQPTEQTHGLRPLRVLDPLMKYLDADYYVGLLSAASHWGAAHHKPQILQVMTAQRHFLKRLEKLRIKFYLKKHFSERSVVSAKTAFGYHLISSPELTALDVISYENASGGFNNVCLVVRDLMGAIKGQELLDCCKKSERMSSVQKLGYMIEKYKAPKKTYDSLRKWVKSRNLSPIPLFAKGERRGPIHKDWKVIENAELEFEE